ncbi:MAG TPA: FkbM family methyltransferase [Vicinamibacterales bacterium]|nr:FkbM family methyltransferase [Vicinamibacterales bacterium]
MSHWLNVMARAVRRAPVPERLRSAVWRSISRAHPGQPYTYPVAWRGASGIYGGVCGFSDQLLFMDLEAYEPESVEVAGDLLRGRTRPVIFDVGAHNGEWLFLLKALAPAAAIHAFEPFPALAAFLETLVAANRWADVAVQQAIVGAEGGEGALHFAAGGSDCASTVADFQPSYTDVLRVPRVALDDYVERARLASVDLIKIDVEGSELEVVQGAKRTLARLHPPLLLELLFTTNQAHLRRQRDLVSLLHGLGYAFHRIEPDGRLTRQDEVHPDERYRALNYLVRCEASCLPAGAVAALTRSASSPAETA